MDCQVTTSQEDEIKQTYFDHLPPEMLMKILKNLDVSSLLSCRLLSRRCNELSCEMLKSQAEIKIGSNYEKLVVANNNKSLMEFVEFLKTSKNFPCSRYHFKLFYNPTNCEDFQTFISCRQNTIKSFDLELLNIDSVQDFNESIQLVEDLLLSQLVNLEEFGLMLDRFYQPKSDVNRFDFSPESQVQLFQLPKLKVVRFSPSLFHEFPSILKNLLIAAVNLKKIESFQCWDFFSKLNEFKFLHSLNKLELLQEAEISPSLEFFSWIKDSIKVGKPVVFKLSKLSLRNYSIAGKPSPTLSEMTLINQIFDSIKDTLKELEVEDSEFLGNLRFPKFTKLRKLSTMLRRTVVLTRNIQFLAAENFPVLHELDLSALNMRVCFAGEDSISIIPSIKSVQVSGCDINEESIEKLFTMCPNLIDLKITGVLVNFSSVGPFIWTHMRSLSSLTLNIYANLGENSMVSILSTFTGISMETCQILMDKFEASEKPMPMSKRLKAKKSLKMSLSEIEKMREHASILDLKDLRSLYVEILVEQSEWDKQSFLDLSKICAFDLMPNTTVSTRIDLF